MSGHQRIYISVAKAAQRNPRKCTVIEFALENINVTRVASEQVQVSREESCADRSAGFQVAVVGQKIVISKSLPGGRRALRSRLSFHRLARRTKGDLHAHLIFHHERGRSYLRLRPGRFRIL